MKRIKTNPDCPLTNKEKKEIKKRLEAIESHYYLPFKHQSGGFATARVYDYDEEEIRVEVTFGVDGQVTYYDEETISRYGLTDKPIQYLGL